MTTTRNTTTIADTCAQRISGLTKHVSSKTEISVHRKGMKPAQVAAVYQAALDARTTLKSRRAAAKVAFQEWQAANAAQSSLDKGLKAWVEVTYGLDSQEARDMGFAPAKAGKRTVEAVQQGITQARATREARHTMGKRQRAKVTGVVPTEPAAPATGTGVSTTPAQPEGSAAPVNGVASPTATHGTSA